VTATVTQNRVEASVCSTWLLSNPKTVIMCIKNNDLRDTWRANAQNNAVEEERKLPFQQPVRWWFKFMHAMAQTD
jgi:hypothetical protein